MAANRAVVVAIRGSVVDIRFDEHLPSIFTVLHAGEEGQIVIEVLAHQNAHHVRGSALTPTQGLARGMAVKEYRRTTKSTAGKGILSRMFDVFGNAGNGFHDVGDNSKKDRSAMKGLVLSVPMPMGIIVIPTEMPPTDRRRYEPIFISVPDDGR